MKRNRIMSRISGIAVIIAGLLVGLAACQNGLTSTVESLPLPYMQPIAVINVIPGEYVSIMNYSFKLEWRRPDGPIVHNAEYSPDDQENIDAMNEALARWNEYVEATDPLPGYQKEGATKVTTGIFNNNRLDNSNTKISADGPIILPRYWPLGTLSGGQSPTKAIWLNARAERVADFKDAVEKIEKMIVTIEESPLYMVEDPVTSTQPLKELHDAMEAHIQYTDANLNDRVEFDKPTGGSGNADLDLTKSGPLYEYYFGFIPDNNATEYVVASGPFVY